MSKGMLNRILLWAVRHSQRVANALNLVVARSVEGAELRVPLLSGVGMQNFTVADHDRALQRAVRSVFAVRQGAVVDVGCNIGHFMQLCVLIDRQRPYVGFDPNVNCCHYVERFIAENRLAAHAVLPVGLSNTVGAETLHLNGRFDVSASLNTRAHPHGHYSQRRSAATVPGDVMVTALGLAPVALIKIDVEGFELEVLEGLALTLRRDRPAVLFEVLSLNRLAGERDSVVAQYRVQRASALRHLFAAQKYLLFRLEPDTSITSVKRLNPADLVHSVQMDHLALPREQAQAVLDSYGIKLEASVTPS